MKEAKSPFIEGLVIPMYLRSHVEETVSLDKIKIGNGVITETGKVTKTTKGYPVEKDRSIHLYYENSGEDLRIVYASISKEGRCLFDYIMFHCLRENKMLFYIDTKDFMDKYMIKSRTTVWNSKNDLVKLGLIAATSVQGWYWINPKYVFRGFRSKLKELEGNLSYYKKES